jgi:myo-inositol-1(or 4)-monophosphatase
MTAVDFAAFVDRLAQVSGEVILPFFRSAIGAEDKSLGGVFDPVTEADRGAEAAMRRLIAQTFPAHCVIGEEYGRDRPEAEYVWVLDPIDGTKSFISGLPTWGTLIGLMHRGKPVYGMMAQPFTRERFYGDGKRARLRTLAPSRGEAPPSQWAMRTLRVRQCASLSAATLMTTSPFLIRDPADRVAYARIEENVRLVRYGGDCYAYCALAAGFIDLVIETGLKPHDVVALAPIIEGAGGVITTWDGEDAAKGGRIIAAGDRAVYDEARRLMLGGEAKGATS